MQVSVTPTLALLGCLVLTAFLVGKLAPTNRGRLGRAAILFGFHSAAFLVAVTLSLFGADTWAARTEAISQLVATFTFLNIAGILIFALVLPLLRIAVTEIVADLTMGAAYLVASLVFMRTAGLDLSGIIATSAVVTAVLGLSLQATLGNILGGLALQLDNSIRVGDWIQLDGGKQGRVAEIHWRHTVVETRDWDTIIVPNANLLAQNITILGKRTNQPVQHRMWVHFNVDYRYSPAEVIRVVEEALRKAPIEGVAQNPPPDCICLDFARDGKDSLALYAVRYFLTDLFRDDPTSSLIRSRIYSALKRADIPLAVPATAVFVSKHDDARAERKKRRDLELRIAALDVVDLFSPMTREEKESLAPKIRHALFAPGEVITRQGAEAHWLYVLTEGECVVKVRNDAGVENVVATLKAPTFFGEMGVMTGARRTATVIAKGEVECFRIDKKDFHGILQKRPEMAEHMSRVLAERELNEKDAAALDLEERKTRTAVEQNRILANIRAFFGLDSSRVA